MKKMKYNRELYSKTALIKAAYNFTDIAYVHLDADDKYYYVTIESKNADFLIDENSFVNEMLTQSVRHEVYQQTKHIRELMLARAMASSVVVNNSLDEENELDGQLYREDEILKDWFENNDKNNV